MSNKRICTGLTQAGAACKGTAVPGTEPALCNSHVNPGSISQGRVEAKGGTLGERPEAMNTIAECKETNNWTLNNLTAGRIGSQKAAAIVAMVKSQLILLSKLEVIDAAHAEKMRGDAAEMMGLSDEDLAKSMVRALPQHLKLIAGGKK